MRDLDWQILSELNKNPNLTQAARKLYLTQPTLTKRLRHIEEEMKIDVFDRTPRGLIFTEAGRYLAGRADDYLRFRQEIDSRLQEIQGGQKFVLRIGSAYTFSKYNLRPLLDPFAQQHPNVSFRVSNKQSNILLKMLEDGEIDAAFVRGDYGKEVNRIELAPTCGYLVTRGPIAIDRLPQMNRITFQTSSRTIELLDAWWHDWFGDTPWKEGGSDGYIEFAMNSILSDDDYLLCFLPEVESSLGQQDGTAPLVPAGLHLTPLFLRDGRQLVRTTWFLYRREKRISRILEDLISYMERETKRQSAARETADSGQ